MSGGRSGGNQDAPVDGPPLLQIAFGPFRFLPARQLLLAGERPVRLGSRARDILSALLERPGQVVTKQDLIARVWPNAFVEEANLRVHVAALRKVLAEEGGTEGPGAETRYITNVSGRGYCFVAEVAVTGAAATAGTREDASGLPTERPRPTSRIVGRAATIAAIAADVLKHRFVTIAGPGGIGKTTVGLAVADALFASFRDGIHFVDLAPIADPTLVPAALAAVLGVAVMSDQPARSLGFYLRNRHLLIVFDNCEHVIEAAAALADEIFRTAAAAHILATSREPLNVEGERVQRLQPLTSPPAATALTAAEALAFPAVQLFVDRAAARIGPFELSDADAPFVADICRRLDGIALAIEIAAGRVDAFGIAGLAGVLDDRFRLLMRGRRTALARHQTLATTLDWSHALLAEPERAVLRRLTVFAGVFTMASAAAVLARGPGDAAEIVECIVNLIGKSLVAADIDGPVAEYRLLDTTRAYAALKLAESGEAEALARRHALHHRHLLEQAQAGWATEPAAAWLKAHRHLIDDLRAALDWSFSATGDTAIGVALTIAAVPLWFQMSLISECRERVLAARAAPSSSRGGDDDMRLHAALAWSTMQIKGSVTEARTAWSRVLELAESLDDADHQLRGLWGLWAVCLNNGDLRGALTLAHRFHERAAHQVRRTDLFVGDRMVGYTLHLLGDQAAARRYIERMLAGYEVPVTGAQIIRFIFDQRVTARCFLARILWLQGFPDQAMATVESIIEGAVASRDALSLCQALVQAACPLALFVGDLPAAARFVDMLIDYSTRHGLEFWQTWGRSFRGLLLIQSGDVAAGLRLLEAAMGDFRNIDFGIYYTAFLAVFAEGLGQAGDASQGLRVIDEALARSEANDERWCMADLLRIKGELALLLGAPGAVAEAEAQFLHALDWARRQQAWAWELRAATSLGWLWGAEGRIAEARAMLAAAYGRFTEGFGTADLARARSVLNTLE